MPAPTLSPSPNHDARPAGVAIDTLVLHYTGMESAAAALARLRDPMAKVSAHYFIDTDGTTHLLVEEGRRAWHAGVSCWRGQAHVNDRSIGIELVNRGHAFGYHDFPPAQMAALTALSKDIVLRHGIPAQNVVGHADVAPERRQDPGERFDWRALAAAGVGLYPAHAPVRGEVGLTLGPGSAGRAVRDLREALADFGYCLPADSVYDAATAAVVAAFQRHFRPDRVDGIADPDTVQRLYQLLGAIA